MRLLYSIPFALLLAPATWSAEVVLDAAPRADLRPGHLQLAVQYPVTVAAEFVIDRTGRARDVRIDPSVPTLFGDSVRRTLERTEAFWPAQGQCRYLEQAARIAISFGAPADGALVSIVSFEALAVIEPATPPVPQADAVFARTSVADTRTRPALAGHPGSEQPPRALSQIKVRIPDEFRHSTGPAGYVWLTFEVTAKGRPRDIETHDVWSRVAGKERHLSVEAERALRAVEFEPARRDGSPIARRGCYLVTFSTVGWLDGTK